jgi:hypothetical protein
MGWKCVPAVDTEEQKGDSSVMHTVVVGAGLVRGYDPCTHVRALSLSLSLARARARSLCLCAIDMIRLRTCRPIDPLWYFHFKVIVLKY